MPDVVNINRLEQLKPFLNNNKVLEIVERQANQKIKNFQKVALLDSKNSEEVSELMASLGSNKSIRDVLLKENLGIVLNGVNLGVTVAGFAIMLKKLNELEHSIEELNRTIQRGFFNEALFKYRDVLGKYEHILDTRKRGNIVKEEDLQNLVHDLDNVLRHFLGFLKSDSYGSSKLIIDFLYSLLSMFTATLMYFDEVYYFNQKGKTDDWHISHDKWMEVFDEMCSDWFVEKLQDYSFFAWNEYGSDIFIVTLLDQVEVWRQEVVDNQNLILELGDIAVINEVREEVSEIAKGKIYEKVDEKTISDELKEEVLEALEWV